MAMNKNVKCSASPPLAPPQKNNNNAPTTTSVFVVVMTTMTSRPPRGVTSAVGELLQPVGRLEVLWHHLVETGNHLVDGLLPRLLLVLLGGDRHVELSHRRLHDVPEPVGHLPPAPDHPRTQYSTLGAYCTQPKSNKQI